MIDEVRVKMLGNNAARAKGCTPRLDLVNGAYYYTPWIKGKQKWIRLSGNYGEALAKWANLEGR